MCGIVGQINQNGTIAPETPERIHKAMQTMRQRGPDGQGIMSGPAWIFGHTRLAIIDPAAGQQPIQDQATGITLTYNGEIYNFRELRTELESCGHQFHTLCDTEVLLRAYIEWGTGCLQRFVGFFAFAVYDPLKKIFFAARDRMGVKPFYYTSDRDRLVFGSTVTAVLTASGVKPELEMTAVSHYLTTGKTSMGEKTLLQNITALMPGRFILLDLNSRELKIERYWQLPIMSQEEKKATAPAFTDAVEEVRLLLSEAVRCRLVSDVPLGAFLSGGLDSAIITTLAQPHLNFNLPVFCAGSDEEQLNEFQYAEMIAAQLGSPLHRTTVDARTFMADWNHLISGKGMPLSTPNEMSIYHLARALKQQCTVTLTGEGADEIFGGYVQPHFSAYDYDRCPHSETEASPNEAVSLALTLQYGRGFFINDTDHYTATSSWMTYSDRAGIFRPDVWQSIDEDDALFCFYEEYFAGLSKCSTFDKRMHLHAEFNLENLLNRVDSSTMAASVEARVPFTDHRLAEYAFRMPDEYKMWWRTEKDRQEGRLLSVTQIDRQDLLETKRLPRQAFKTTLPREIIERKKMSFPVPFEKWFFGDILAEVNKICHDSPLNGSIFNSQVMEGMLQQRNRNLWLIANLCVWWDNINSRE